MAETNDKKMYLYNILLETENAEQEIDVLHSEQWSNEEFQSTCHEVISTLKENNEKVTTSNIALYLTENQNFHIKDANYQSDFYFKI